MHFGQSLKKYLESLKMKPSELAEMMGESRQNANNLLRQAKPTYARIEKAAKALGKSVNELLSELEDKAGIDPGPTEAKKLPAIAPRSTAHLVPFYDIDVTAGIEKVFNDEAEVPSYYFDIPAFIGCKSLPMRGDSMMDAYHPGDILFVQEITYWPRWMIWNRVYVVVTREERVIKLVDKGDQEGYWKLISINPVHRPVDIPVDEILKVYVVRGALRQDSYVVQQRVILREEEFLKSQNNTP